MKSYSEALSITRYLQNTPNPDTYPGQFIIWAEDICELLSHIYGVEYDTVVENLQEVFEIDTDD
jgi:hypothetical protein